MHFIVRDTLQLNVENSIYSILDERKFSKQEIETILEGNKRSNYCSIVNEIVREIKKDYSFGINDDVNYVAFVASNTTDDWLKNNGEKFETFLKKKLKHKENKS